MICLAFHNPANIRQLLSEDKFHVTTIFSDDDVKSLKSVKTEKTKVIFCNSVSKIRQLAKDEKFKKIIKSRKVVCFDTPHNFFINNYVMDDAKNRTDGIWAFKPVDSFNVENLVLNTEKGLKGKKLKGDNNE